VEVDTAELSKGYEVRKDRFVLFSEEELVAIKKVLEERSIEIIDFVKLDEIDPLYFNRSYYIGPGENSLKAYSLLKQALQQSGKLGVAKITLRSKEQLVCIRVYEQVLVMETLHYADELKSVLEVPGLKEVATSEQELRTAMLLIDQLTTTFTPAKYQDDFRAAFHKLAERKLERHEDKAVGGVAQENIIDLMSALEASLKQTQRKQSTNKAADAK
jgi:DNA end-binding protein Ku